MKKIKRKSKGYKKGSPVKTEDVVLY